MIKKCKECDEVKNATEFQRNTKAKDGYLSTCTACLRLKRLSSGSLRDAINSKCKDCIYDPYAKGAWREQVEECTGGDCALYSVRPMPRRRDADG